MLVLVALIRPSGTGQRPGIVRELEVGIEMSMKSGAIFAMTVGALAVTTLSGPAHAITVTSFETPVVIDGYQYNASSPFAGPNGPLSSPTDGVTLGGTSGIQANGSAFGFNDTPYGNQTAFLQSYMGSPNPTATADAPGFIMFSNGSLTAGLTYDLIFFVESRPVTGGLPYTVVVNGISNVFGTPSTVGWSQESVAFTATGVTDNFEIAINAPANVTDNSIGVDEISIAPTPLPSTWMMLLAGFAGLGFFANRGGRNRSAFSAA
jgi:hypothetical protein